MQVGKLKDLICNAVGGGLTPARMVLRQMQNLVMRDMFTLAFYNVPDSAVITMAVK